MIYKKNSIQKLLYLASILFSLLLIKCAFIVHGFSNKQNIEIISDPPKANVIVNYQYYDKTPTIVRLLRTDEQYIRIELEGYLPYEITLKKKIDGWFWGNIFFGGPVGMLIDYATGSIYKLNPSQINTELKRVEKKSYLDKYDIYINVGLISDSSLTIIGNLEKK